MRVANAAPSFAGLNYQREQRDRIVTLGFKSAANYDYDADTYDFHVYERSLDPQIYTPRSWTFSHTLQPDRGYTLVLTEVGGEVAPVFVEYPPAPAAEAQVVGLHAAPGLPAMDLYLERPGVGIAGATPRGSFNVFEQIAPRTLASGEYELWLTAAGNPANVLLATTTIVLDAGFTNTIVVVPEPGQAGTQMSVLFVQANSVGVYDRNVTAALRVINGATDTLPRDFALDNQYSPPLFSAMPFTEPTAYAAVSPATHTISVTPVGNPGVLELNQALTPGAAQLNTVLFAGPAGVLVHTATADDGRRIANESKLLLMNAATQFQAVDFVLTLPDVNPATVNAFATLAAPGSTVGYSAIPPGAYDLYLRNSLSGAFLFGPTRLSVASGGIYGVLAINGADTATAAISLFDDFP